MVPLCVGGNDCDTYRVNFHRSSPGGPAAYPCGHWSFRLDKINDLNLIAIPGGCEFATVICGDCGSVRMQRSLQDCCLIGDMQRHQRCAVAQRQTPLDVSTIAAASFRDKRD